MVAVKHIGYTEMPSKQKTNVESKIMRLMTTMNESIGCFGKSQDKETKEGRKENESWQRLSGSK